MSKISLIAKLKAADDKVDDIKTALAGAIAAADEEPGLTVYSASQDQNDETVFYFFELYESAEAFEVHGKGDGMKAAMKAIGACLAGRPEVTLMNPVVAKGLDFS